MMIVRSVVKSVLCIALLLCSVVAPTGGDLVASDGCAVTACCVSVNGVVPECCEIGEAELPHPELVMTRVQSAHDDAGVASIEAIDRVELAIHDFPRASSPDESPPPRERLIELGSFLI